MNQYKQIRNPSHSLRNPIVVSKPTHRHHVWFTFTNRPLTTCLAAAQQQQPNSTSLADKTRNSFVVIGGGPGGLATALALQNIGLPVTVLEREGEQSTAGTALGLWTNAWRALDALGVGDSVRSMHPIVDRVELCRDTGRTLRTFSLSDCSGGPHEFRGVRRSNLTTALASKLKPDTITYNTPITTITTGNSGNSPTGDTVVRLENGESIPCIAVIGADGVRGASVAATGLQPARYVGQVAIRGVARFPKGVPCEVIRQVWSVGPRAGMYPISAKELYWFVCFDAPANAPIPEDQIDIQNEAAAIVKDWGWGLPDIVANTPLGEFSRSRLADRWTTSPINDITNYTSVRPLLTLAGDALHPMTPNLGQGGCTALEDAIVLARQLQKCNIPSLLSTYTAAQQKESNTTSSTVLKTELQVAIRSAFAEYEQQRIKRCLPLTVRSFAMGAALQLPIAPVAAVRDIVVSTVFDPSHFLDHAEYDCRTA